MARDFIGSARPNIPTTEHPGTEAKILVMEGRASRCEDLFSLDDAKQGEYRDEEHRGQVTRELREKMDREAEVVSRYKGVIKKRNNPKWIAQIWRGGRMIYLGSYRTELAAARVVLREKYGKHAAKVSEICRRATPKTTRKKSGDGFRLSAFNGRIRPA